MAIKAELPKDLKKAGRQGERLQNMSNLIKACEQAGLSNPRFQAAVCGICAGESGFLAVEEGCYYSSVERIRKVFGKLGKWSDGELTEYIKLKSTEENRKKFFGFMYTRKSGRYNYSEIQGGNYYGRGLVQLTFEDGYKGAQEGIKKLFGEDIDLVANPKLAMTAPFSAKCVLGFYIWKCRQNKDKLKRISEDPNVLNILLQFCGGAHERWPLKRQYYAEFLANSGVAAPSDYSNDPIPVPTESSGESSDPDNKSKVPHIDCHDFPKSTNKDSGAYDTQKSQKEINREQPHKQEALYEDRSQNFSKYGFTDPNGKYPLREYMNEPDCNRLARGVTKGTHVEFKDAMRNTHCTLPGGASWDQPHSAYAARYPFNKVNETESGHVMEFDDTPGAERINLYHRKGTYIEIDNNGTQINHIIGDGYWISENNGNVLIKGNCNVTIGGDSNLHVSGDANIEIDGNCHTMVNAIATLDVASDLFINVGENLVMSVGKNFNIEVGTVDDNKKDTKEEDKIWGGVTLKSKGQIEIESTTDLFSLKTKKSISTYSEKTTTINSKENLTLNTSKSALYESKEDTTSKAGHNMHLDTKHFFNITSDSLLTLGSKQRLSINSGDNIHLGAREIHLTANKVPLENYVKKPALKPKGLGMDEKGNPNDEVPESPEIPIIDVKFNPKSKITPGDEDDEKNTTSEKLHFKRNELKRKFNKRVGPTGGFNPEPLQPCDRLYDQTVKMEDEDSRSEPRTERTRSMVDNEYNKNDHYEEVESGEMTIDKDEHTCDNEEGFRKGNVHHDKKADPNGNNLYKDKSTNTDSTGSPTKIELVKDPECKKLNPNESYSPSYKLSEHFVLGNLMSPGNTLRDIYLPGGSIYGGGKARLYTVDDLVKNMSLLSSNILERLYEMLGPCGGLYGSNAPGGKWQITGGIQTAAKYVKGRKLTSDHFKGRAVDFQYKPKRGITEVYNLAVEISKSDIPFSQLIFEQMSADSYWIHLAFAKSTFVDGGQTDSSGNGTRSIKSMIGTRMLDGIKLYR
jgi:predicted chitinase